MDAPLLIAATAAPATLRQLQGANTLVVEFWKPDCERCPAALCKLNALAATATAHPIIFVACALVSPDMVDDINEFTR